MVRRMTHPSGRTRRPTRTLRLALLVAVVATLGVLTFLVATNLGRIGLFPGDPGRTAAPGESAWIRLAPAPSALTEVAAAAHEGKVWVVGGLDASGAASVRTLIYDTASDSWSEGPRLLAGVHHAALVSDGSTLFLLGGYLGPTFDQPTDEVWRLDAGASSWVRDVPLPEPRGAGAAAFDGIGTIFFGGGVGPGGVSDVIYGSDPAAGWREIARLREPREHLAATASGAGTVTFMGGRRGDVGNLGTVDSIDAAGVLGGTEDVPTPRGGVAAFSWPALGDCLVGGEGPNGTFGDVECMGTTEITSLPGLGVPRHGLGAVVIGRRVYVVLGGPQPGLTVSDVVEALDLPATVSR
jgi:hypothetical protein